MNERVTVNGAVFFVGWRLTPYPTYRYLALLSAMRAGTLPDGGALRLIRATVPYIKRLLNTVGPRKRSAAGQAVPDPVPVIVPDGGYALSGLQSPVYQTVTHTVGPRKRMD